MAARHEQGRTAAACGRNFGLDAARCAAIGLVLLAHCGAAFLALYGHASPLATDLCGALGVDLFFVLSGLLIGRLLFAIAEQGATARGWLVFLQRRWLRTLPLYLLWLGVLLAVLPPPEDAALHLLAFATLSQNLAWAMPADDWFKVSWSLTVEEWFYVLFSAALLGASALAGARRAAWPVILAFLLVPLALRSLHPAVADYSRAVEKVTLYRLDAIAYGVALARLHAHGLRLFRRPLLCAALGAALVGGFWAQRVAGVYLPLPPVAFLALESVATPVGLALLLSALLRLPAPRGALAGLVRGGSNISYGVYIMHMTIVSVVFRVAAVYGIGRGATVGLCVALMLALPWASFRWLEAPILARRPLQRAPAAKQARQAVRF